MAATQTTPSARSRRAGIWILRSLLVVGAVLIAYWTAVYTIANIARTGNPALALRFVANDSRALERLADIRLQDALKNRRWDAPARLARAALKRDATSDRAVRVLATLAEGGKEEGRVAALLDYADSLSRRDVGVRLYLIERSVAKGDVTGALRNFDIALRTSDASFDILAPVLANAVADESLIPPIARLFDTDPPWLPRFLEFAVAQSRSPTSLAKTLLRAKSSKAARSSVVVQQLLYRLVKEEKYSAAEEFFEAVTPAWTNGLVRDENFSMRSAYFPFEWSLVTESDRGVEAGTGGDRSGLRYYASSGQGGEVAKQMLTLEEGRYVLQSQGSNPSDDPLAKPVWIVRCATKQGQRLLELSFPPRQPNVTRVQAGFSVPSGCSAQWLFLELRASQGVSGLEGEVRNVAVARASSRQR